MERLFLDPQAQHMLLQKRLITVITSHEETDESVAEVRSLLEEKGADPRAYAYTLYLYYKSYNYFSPLHYAAVKGSIRILDLLLKTKGKKCS
jgi:hypothetical protein